jgi:predicted transglutaminase-like protease
MCMNRIKKSKPRISYWIACHIGGYCPTLKEVDDTEIKELAKRLQGASKKETLANILEWQEANITFWDERHPTPTILLYSIIAIFPVFLALGVFLSLIWLLVFQQFVLPSIILIWISAFASNIITAIVMVAIIIKTNRKIPLKEGLFNAFRISISIKMLLKRDRKLGICRDYAKLTACLMSNIDNGSEVYFLHSKAHVAAGMKIGEELYMLDQRLPVLTIDQWYKREHGLREPSKIFFLYRNAHKLTGNRLESIPLDTLLSKTEITKVNSPSELALELSKLLNIPKNVSKAEHELLTIDLPKWNEGASLYAMNDEVVNYSLARSLKRKISNQQIDLSQIEDIEAKKENEDLIFQIVFRPKSN